MKIIFSLLGIILLPLICYSQVQNRVIDLNPRSVPSNFVKGEDGKMVSSEINALEIIEIKVEDKSISPGQPFSANENWLKNLAVRVRNVSGKPISSIRISFVIPEAKYRDGVMGFSLEYGKALNTGINYGEQKVIMPNEEIDLIRNEAHYNRDWLVITQRSGLTDFSKVLMSMATVQFEDGAIWSSWKLPISKPRN